MKNNELNTQWKMYQELSSAETISYIGNLFLGLEQTDFWSTEAGYEALAACGIICLKLNALSGRCLDDADALAQWTNLHAESVPILNTLMDFNHSACAQLWGAEGEYPEMLETVKEMQQLGKML